MRTLRFHEYGSALDVLRLDDAEAPTPGSQQVRAPGPRGPCTSFAPFSKCRGMVQV